jgi:excisionase family DNA binding protein
MSNDHDCETMSVPEAGRKYLGLKRDASYRAAKRKDIPTVSVGRLLRVPKRAMERLLDAVGGQESSDPSAR